MLGKCIRSLNNLIQRNKIIEQHLNISLDEENFYFDQIRVDIKKNHIIKFPMVVVQLTQLELQINKGTNEISISSPIKLNLMGDVDILKKLGMDNESYELPNEQTFIPTSKFLENQDIKILGDTDSFFD